jgi:hypothetical protein
MKTAYRNRFQLFFFFPLTLTGDEHSHPAIPRLEKQHRCNHFFLSLAGVQEGADFKPGVGVQPVAAIPHECTLHVCVGRPPSLHFPLLQILSSNTILADCPQHLSSTTILKLELDSNQTSGAR